MIGTRQRIDYRSGKATIRRTATSYDRLMQVVTEEAIQRAMVRMNRRKYMTPPRPPRFKTRDRLVADF
jgi:hypothetical protein